MDGILHMRYDILSNYRVPEQHECLRSRHGSDRLSFERCTNDWIMVSLTLVRSLVVLQVELYDHDSSDKHI